MRATRSQLDRLTRENNTLKRQFNNIQATSDEDEDIFLPKKARANSEILLRARATFGILLARKIPCIENNTYRYVFGTLKDSFTSLMEAPNQLFATDLKKVHNVSKGEASENTHYLAVHADKELHLSAVLVKKITSGGSMYSKVLGQLSHMDEFERDWGLIHFGSAGKSESDRRLHQQAREDTDLLVEQHPIHQQKKDTSMPFTTTVDASMDAILTTVANFLVFLGSVVHIAEWGESPNNPIIVNYLIALCDIVGTTDKHKIVELASLPENKHLMFCIFSSFSDIVSSFGKVLMESNAVALVSKAMSTGATGCSLMDHDLTKMSIVKETFEKARRRLSQLVSENSLGDFAAPPRSFQVFHPVPAPKPPKDSDLALTKSAGSGRPFGIHSTADGQKMLGNYDSHIPNRQYVGQRQNNRRYKPYTSNFIAQPTSQIQLQNQNPNQTQGTITTNGDWLVALNNAPLKEFEIPQGIAPFCKRFAFKGKICPYGSSCTFRHIPLDGLSADEKAVMTNYLAANPTKFQLS